NWYLRSGPSFKLRRSQCNGLAAFGLLLRGADGGLSAKPKNAASENMDDRPGEVRIRCSTLRKTLFAAFAAFLCVLCGQKLFTAKCAKDRDEPKESILSVC